MVDGQKPHTLLQTLNVTNQDLHPNIYAIFILLITMPVSSASSERSFSAIRCVKNSLRATMGDERLSNLSLLHIHRTRNLSVEDVINKFAARKKTDVWTLSNYQSVLLDMMAACAYMNSETLFFECFRECFFHTFCIYAEFLSPRSTGGGYTVLPLSVLPSVLPSVHDVFRRIFHSNY